MNVILLGPPGCGKGTQGALLAKTLSIPKIATGDLLRSAVREGTPLGSKAKQFMDQGLLVPDEVILGLIEEVLERDAARNGVIMDGFPRTVAQAEAVDRLLHERSARVDHVLSFTVSDEQLIARMMGRAQQEGRSDDTPEAIKKRLQVFRDETAPVVAHYERQGIVTEIPGEGTVEQVAQRVQGAVS
jgi:adenylate kinase